MASFMSLAATVLSTPPETAPICEISRQPASQGTCLSRRAKTHDLGLISNQLANPQNLLLGEIFHLPVRLRFANLQGKVGENFSTPDGVRNLGVELDAC
jgi:hypothetical protein